MILGKNPQITMFHQIIKVKAIQPQRIQEIGLFKKGIVERISQKHMGINQRQILKKRKPENQESLNKIIEQ